MSDMSAVMPKYTYWDVHFKRTKKNTLSFINGIFLVNGRITDSDNFGVYEGMKNWHNAWILVRVAIPAGKEQLFMDWTDLKLEEPPKVSMQGALK